MLPLCILGCLQLSWWYLHGFCLWGKAVLLQHGFQIGCFCPNCAANIIYFHPNLERVFRNGWKWGGILPVLNGCLDLLVSARCDNRWIIRFDLRETLAVSLCKSIGGRLSASSKHRPILAIFYLRHIILQLQTINSTELRKGQRWRGLLWLLGSAGGLGVFALTGLII